MLKQTTTYAIRIGGATLLALAAACGGDDQPSGGGPGGGFDSGVAPAVVDAGTSTPGTGATGGGLDASACVTVPGLGTGVTCTLAGGNPGYRTCVNGVPTGDCISFVPEGGLGAIFGDGGIASFLDGSLLGDTGLSFNDGSITFGDATITLPEAGTLKCPAGYMCSSTLGALFPGISACVKEGGDGLFPDTCTTPMGACKTGTASGTCQNVLIGNYCITPCN
jgi:hypothetical protein